MTPATTDRINDRRAPQGPRQSTLAILRQLARTYCVSSALPATLNGYLAN